MLSDGVARMLGPGVTSPDSGSCVVDDACDLRAGISDGLLVGLAGAIGADERADLNDSASDCTDLSERKDLADFVDPCVSLRKKTGRVSFWGPLPLGLTLFLPLALDELLPMMSSVSCDGACGWVDGEGRERGKRKEEIF